MAEQKEATIFRKKTMDRISSPEQLTDYLRVTNPGIWVVLVAVILLLAGIFAWAAVGTLETTVNAAVIVEEQKTQVIPTETQALSEGMKLRIDEKEYTITSTEEDAYGRTIGITETGLPDGTYEGIVVVEQIRPLDFLLTSR